MDLAAIIKPIASYWPIITNTIVRIRSKFPISAPAFLIFSQDCASPIWYFFKISLIRILAGLMHSNIANMDKGMEKVVAQSADWTGNSVTVLNEKDTATNTVKWTNWSRVKLHNPLGLCTFTISIARWDRAMASA